MFGMARLNRTKVEMPVEISQYNSSSSVNSIAPAISYSPHLIKGQTFKAKKNVGPRLNVTENVSRYKFNLLWRSGGKRVRWQFRGSRHGKDTLCSSSSRPTVTGEKMGKSQDLLWWNHLTNSQADISGAYRFTRPQSLILIEGSWRIIFIVP